MNEYLSISDLVISTLILVFFYFVATSIKRRNIESLPYYKYFVPGLFVKVFSGVCVCLVYLYYYPGGGDTTLYFHDNVCLSKLFLKDPISALKFTFTQVDERLLYSFDRYTDWPIYAHDKHAVYVTKITWILSLITFNSFIGQTMMLAFLTYFPIWRMYKMFVTEFDSLQKGLAISILFIPSVVFWGSGLLKDSITFSAVSLFTSSFYYLIKFKKKYFVNLSFLFFSSLILIKIKPYIFFALLPGTIIWFTSYILENINNKLVRASVRPTLIVVSLFIGYIFLDIMGDSLKEYSVYNVLESAVSSQQDLKQDYYHGSSFDIGDFNPTVQGVLSKAPIAIISALFRPFLWESHNPAMVVSGIENLVILIFTIYLLIRLRVYNFIGLLVKNHLLFFSVSFSLFFAFAVGLSTSNFGSLARYKIPAIPFFVASLVISNYFYEQKNRNSKGVE